MQTSQKLPKIFPVPGQPLTHAGADAIWLNANYDDSEAEVLDWTQWSPESDLGFEFQNEVARLKQRYSYEAETNFSLDLAGNMVVEPPTDLAEQERIAKGEQRILNAVHSRYKPELAEFLKIHDQMQAFLMFTTCVRTRFPDYRFERHPQFGPHFERLFNRALKALEGWTDPWDRRRDRSPKRRAASVK